MICLPSHSIPVATAASRSDRPLHQHHHQPRPLGHLLPEHAPRRPSDPQRLAEAAYLPSRMSRQHVQGGRAGQVVGFERRVGGFRKGRLRRRWGQRFLPVAEDAKVSACAAISLSNYLVLGKSSKLIRINLPISSRPQARRLPRPKRLRARRPDQV
jgi:hypothetical protein